MRHVNGRSSKVRKPRRKCKWTNDDYFHASFQTYFWRWLCDLSWVQLFRRQILICQLEGFSPCIIFSPPFQTRCHWSSREQWQLQSRSRDRRLSRDGHVFHGECLSKELQPATVHRPARRVRVSVAHGQVSATEFQNQIQSIPEYNVLRTNVLLLWVSRMFLFLWSSQYRVKLNLWT